MALALQRIMVIGGAQGLGRAVAEHLARCGASLTLTSRSLAKAESAVAALALPAREEGQAHAAIEADVRDRKQLRAACRALARSGGLHGLVNAAGLASDALVLRAGETEAREMFEINLLGALNVSAAAGEAMLRQGDGCVIHVGSAAALRPRVGNAVYAATKAGLHALAQGAALELAPRGIRFNVVAPGYVTTDMTAHLDTDALCRDIPMGRLGQPEDVARAVEFLLTAPYVTGHVLVVDGGLTL